MVVALEAGGAVLEQRCLDRARRQGQGWRGRFNRWARRSMSLAAAVQQPDGRAVVDQLAGDVDPGWPRPDVVRQHRGLVADLALVAETRGTR
jgi:hypothetical protein